MSACLRNYSDARSPFGRNRDPVRRIRAAIHAIDLAVPFDVSGGVPGFVQTDAALANGRGDIAGFGRQASAGPDWFGKVVSDTGERVGVCLYTGCCEALDQRHKQATCEMRDREALNQLGVKHTSDSKRRLTPPPWTESS